jgi:hypothetical protein
MSPSGKMACLLEKEYIIISTRFMGNFVLNLPMMSCFKCILRESLCCKDEIGAKFSMPFLQKASLK